MSRFLLRGAAAGAAALLAGLLTIPSAQADIQTFPDVGGHITEVRVSHGPGTVGITAHDDGISRRAHHYFWLDTDPGNPGPEFKAEVYQSPARARLMLVANFASSGITFDCDGFRAEIGHLHEGYVKVVIPRICITTPSTVRVAVVGFYNEDADSAIDVTDWAPGEQRFYPSVNR